MRDTATRLSPRLLIAIWILIQCLFYVKQVEDYVSDFIKITSSSLFALRKYGYTVGITHIFVAKLWVLKVFNSSKSIFLKKKIFLQGKRIIWLTYINETFLAHVKDFIELLQTTPEKSWFPLKMSPMWKKYHQSNCLSSNWKEKKIKEKRNKQWASVHFWLPLRNS